MINDSLHNALYSARKKAGRTQQELADVLQVNRATISKYENGSISPSIDTLQQIATALDVSVTSLLSIDEENEVAKKFINDFAVDFPNAPGVTVVDGTVILLTDGAIKQRIDEMQKRIMALNEGGQYLATKTIEAFCKLNPEGQAVAVGRVEELTEIPKYQKKPEDEDPAGDEDQD